MSNHEGQATRLGIFDPALALLIGLLKDHDLYENTITTVATEFGRTPKLNLAWGREHLRHGTACSPAAAAFAAGLRSERPTLGGESQEPAGKVRVEDIHATIFHQVGINYDYEQMTPAARPIGISNGGVIRDLTS